MADCVSALFAAVGPWRRPAMFAEPLRYMRKSAFWLALLALITLSLMPTKALPAPIFQLWDKAQHALGFASLMLLGLWAYPTQTHRLVPGLLLLGIGIELTQASTGWRQGDGLDLLANTVGMMLAWLIVRWWRGQRQTQ